MRSHIFSRFTVDIWPEKLNNLLSMYERVSQGDTNQSKLIGQFLCLLPLICLHFTKIRKLNFNFINFDKINVIINSFLLVVLLLHLVFLLKLYLSAEWRKEEKNQNYQGHQIDFRKINKYFFFFNLLYFIMWI